MNRFDQLQQIPFYVLIRKMLVFLNIVKCTYWLIPLLMAEYKKRGFFVGNLQGLSEKNLQGMHSSVKEGGR